MARRKRGDNVDPNRVAQNLVTNLSRHEPQHRKADAPFVTKIPNGSSKVLGQVSRGAGILKIVDTSQYFVNRLGNLKKLGITSAVSISPCAMTLLPKQQVYWEITPSSGPPLTRMLLFITVRRRSGDRVIER